MYKNELVEDDKIGPSWEDVNMAFEGKVSNTAGKMSIFGPGGELAYEMWENGYLSMSIGLLQNADILIPERNARKMALKAFKEWQDQIRDN